ncbi:hypothetical protein DCAR_0101393 [Daucus carota subsp. sativus]|uniref:Uncharacterized protein n=1 Tax=Daucus carota subsp. sativus TaxID=79200 RepID=A0A166GC22_DAUCS|nr:hypothetical protein DCAR_0101393 [Daucus carota subsp. sativus]
MAKNYSLNFLFFFIALIIFNLPSLHATTTTSLSPLPPLNQEIDAVIEALLCESNYEALLCESNFTIWAHLLNVSKTQLVLPVNATMFAPTDAAISHLAELNPHLIPYHVTPNHHLLFSRLLNLEPLSLLPTLVPDKTILITSTLPWSYKVDKAIITQPNIYISSRLVVHGIDHVLDLHPQRSSMPPLLRAGNQAARISPSPA